jgi:AraC-like DNA-binding protein
MSVIRIDHLPAAERFEFWRDVTCRTWVPMETHTDDQANFWAQLRSSGMGAVQANVITSRPHVVHRTPTLIRQCDPDLLKIVMPLPGSTPCVVEQDGRQARLAQANFALYDTTRPYMAGAFAETGIGELMTLMFPRSLLPVPPAHIPRLLAVPMRAGQGVGALTSHFLVQLARNLDHYSPIEAVRVSTVALEMLATRLAHELQGDGWVAPETSKRVLLARIYAFIEQRLGDPDLSPDTIAAAHHISTRYLHKLFEAEDSTVAAWVRRRRLDHCRRDLVDPTHSRQSASAIAMRWGFPSPTHFGRVFRATYGVAPGEYRVMHAPATPQT